MNQSFMIGIVILACSLLVAVAAVPPEDKVVFLDVGQGDSILIQNGIHQILVDGGPGAAVLEQLAREMPTFDKKVDVLILSHPQQDHLEGLRHVLERYSTELVVLPAATTESQLFQSFIDLLVDRNIPYRFAWAGQQLMVGDIHVQILAPFDIPAARTIARADVNNASTSLRVDFNNLSLLLTGDAEQVAEQLLVQHISPELLDVQILKAGHHGSNSSTHLPLLQATSPSAAVISVGADNRFGHPHPAVLERLAGIPTFRTDEHGSIQFFYADQQWRLTCVSC